MRRIVLLPLIVLLAAGCGDAVTDPSREGFEANPRLIEGDWATIFRTNLAVTRYDAELLPAGGEFSVSSVFPRGTRCQDRVQCGSGTAPG